MRKLLILPLLLLLSLVTACGDDDDPTGVGEGSIAGTYNLQTVQGNSLPYTILQIGEDKLEILSGRVTINQDNTFSTSLTLRATEGGSVTTTTETDNGTYTRNNNAVQFTFGDGTTSTGSISGNTLTVTDEGLALVFRK